VREALADGRYADAARLARTSAAADPLRAELHYLLGRALADAGQDDEALPALRRAVYLDPADGLAHFLLAGALARPATQRPQLASTARRRTPCTVRRSSRARTSSAAAVRGLARVCEQLDRRLSDGGGR
jgi:tetratricopeptide (TPR) repeat protein